MNPALACDYEIRQIYARIQDAVWRKDSSGFSACFAEDALWQIMGRDIEGRAEIASFLDEALALSDFVLFQPSQPLLTMQSQTRALGQVRITETIKRKSGEVLCSLGHYEDLHELGHGQWQIRRHSLRLNYLGPPDFSGALLSP